MITKSEFISMMKRNQDTSDLTKWDEKAIIYEYENGNTHYITISELLTLLPE